MRRNIDTSLEKVFLEKTLKGADGRAALKRNFQMLNSLHGGIGGLQVRRVSDA
jgi:hypothetical protein